MFTFFIELGILIALVLFLLLCCFWIVWGLDAYYDFLTKKAENILCKIGQVCFYGSYGVLVITFLCAGIFGK